MKPTRKKFPILAAALDEYFGGPDLFDKLMDVKRATTHGYIVVAWMDKNMVDYADLSSADNGKTWEMQNDGHEHITLATWKKAKIVPDCDWLDIADM